jgi:dolichyl-diphosphooligosaccharide--protein glycosyltransferase
MKKNLLLAACLTLVLGVNIYYRLFPVYLPQFKTEARDTAERKIREAIVKDIDKKYPEFSALAKSGLVEKTFLQYKKNNAPDVKRRIRQEYAQLKSRYQDAGGQTYLLELDCWNWARYTENVCRLGHPGDKVVNGQQIDSLTLAPGGSALSWSQFLFYFSAWLYKIFSFVFNSVPVYQFVFYLPLVFITIFLIVLYLFCFYRWGNLGATITCLFVGFSPLFVGRSCAGWFDTDILQLLFPLLSVIMYLKASEANALKTRCLWACFSAFWIGLFSYTWIYWWFIFFIILMYEAYSVANLAFLHFRRQKNSLEFKQHIFSTVTFVFFTVFWVVLFSGVEPLSALYAQAMRAVSLNNPIVVSIWPNVLSTVSELKRAPLAELIGCIGGSGLVAGAWSCLMVLFLRTVRNPLQSGFQRECILILFFWFLSMAFATFKGARFTLFLLIPLGIALGWMTTEAYHYFKPRSKPLTFFVCAIVFYFGIEFFYNAQRSIPQMCPYVDDTWYNTLGKIKRQTPRDAIVNAWWDYGDWIKAIARRRVIFDGQNQEVPQAYWMANAFTTTDEKEAVALLRMLDNGGNKAFEIIDRTLKDPFASLVLLKRVLLSDAQQAGTVLSASLPPGDAAEVLRLVFATPGRAYCMVDTSMIQATRALSFVGNWDFTKVCLSQKVNARQQANKTIDYFVKLGIDKKELEKLYQEAALISGDDFKEWVSHPLEFYSKLLKGSQKEGIILFDTGIVYNPREKTVYIFSTKEGKYKIPKSLFVSEGDTLEEHAYDKNDLDEVSALIFKDGKDYYALLLDPALVKSMLVRLCFLQGAGLKHFKPFITGESPAEEGEPRQYIRVFQIDWSGL